MDNTITAFIAVTWRPLVEILILWVVIYLILRFFVGTRALQLLRGIIILLFVFFLVQQLNLTVLDWLLNKLFAISVIAILIVFHPEIRQGLSRLGQKNPFAFSLKDEEIDEVLKQIGAATDNLCKAKRGALIAIEHKDSLAAYIETGVYVQGKVSSELIETIFTPNSLLHDGGLIIKDDRVVAAGCLFPLTQNPDLSRVFGTRHRAALGLSEETDAFIVIVSEERHDVSLVHQSQMYKDLSKEELMIKIRDLMKQKGRVHP